MKLATLRRGGRDGRLAVVSRDLSRCVLVQAWEQEPQVMRFVYKSRQEIERVFGVLTCTAGGLTTLPAWVRHLDRVRRWVGVKIILYNARLDMRKRHQPLAAA